MFNVGTEKKKEDAKSILGGQNYYLKYAGNPFTLFPSTPSFSVRFVVFLFRLPALVVS